MELMVLADVAVQTLQLEADTAAVSSGPADRFQIYRALHFIGILALYLSIGGLFLHALNGGTKQTNENRKIVAITHGVAMFIVLLGGFGMLATFQRAGIASSHDPWVMTKLGIWLLMGAMIAIPYRVPSLARPLWLLLPIVGGFAGWVAQMKF